MEPSINKIIMIGTYFGKWPVWFPAFLLSCAKNETIDWFLFTDSDVPRQTFTNIRFHKMNLEQFNTLASKQLGFQIKKEAYSQVDLQPAYGLIFDEYIKAYDFWGHFDMDVVWGNIRSFITEEHLQNYDILTCRKDFLAGHLTLWRNVPEVNTLFQAIPAYRDIFSCSRYHNFDENIISTFLRPQIVEGNSKLRIYWPEQMVTWFEGNHTPKGWYWKQGRIFDSNHREYIYLHFQRWKKFVTTIDFELGDQPESFRITAFGIRSRQPSQYRFLVERLNWRAAKGGMSHIFGKARGFLRLLKRFLFVRNIYWAQKLAANFIPVGDVRYEPRIRRLYLKPLDLCIAKRQHFLLEGYDATLQLHDKLMARFYEEADRLFVNLAGLRFAIQSAEDLVNLKELFVDGKYNMLFSRPVVVLDIGMRVGFASLYFASHPDAVVFGYEPCKKEYERALHNISLNPSLAGKIHPVKASISDAEFRTIAHFFTKLSMPRLFSATQRDDTRTGPPFEYEEVEIEDIATILDLMITNYPEREIVVKIDFQNPEYYIDGVGEDHLINRLAKLGKLELIDAIMLVWNRSGPVHKPPVIARQLSDCGFTVFSFSPYETYTGSLYAVREKERCDRKTK